MASIALHHICFACVSLRIFCFYFGMLNPTNDAYERFLQAFYHVFTTFKQFRHCPIK